MNKISIIGTGSVGSTIAYTLTGEETVKLRHGGFCLRSSRKSLLSRQDN